jgi:hypothetical protein
MIGKSTSNLVIKIYKTNQKNMKTVILELHNPEATTCGMVEREKRKTQTQAVLILLIYPRTLLTSL